MLSSLDNEPLKYKLVVYLDVTTGLRRGELMGLEWQDIDFTNSTLTVRQASQYLPNKGIFTKDPKTESSKRIMSLSPTVIALLQKYKEHQDTVRTNLGTQWYETGRLFTQFNGKPTHPDTISQWFSDFIKRSELPYISFHGLRHTNASLLIAEGINLKTVSTRLGHANIATTMLYVHPMKKADTVASDKFETLIKKKDDNSKVENPDE